MEGNKRGEEERKIEQKSGSENNNFEYLALEQNTDS